MPIERVASEASSSPDARMRIANFSLVPFAAEILSDLSIRPRRTAMLPLHQPQLLTLEAVEAVAEIIRRGVLKFLVRQGGWQRRRWTMDAQDRPGGPQRLLEHLSDQGVKIHYTDRAIDAMLCAYNAMAYLGGARQHKTQGPRTFEYAAKAQPLESNGDVLLHYILGFAIGQTHYHVEPAHTAYFGRNPLAQLATFRVPEAHQALGLVEGLFGPGLEPLAPWLVPHLAARWALATQRRWESLKDFERWTLGMGGVMEGFLELAKARERQDMLIGPMHFYANHFAPEGAEGVWLGEFREMTQAFRLADRDTLRRAWARALWPAWRIWEAYRQARGTAPVDRVGGDTLLMEAIEMQGSNPLEYEKVAWRARSFAEQLESVIS